MRPPFKSNGPVFTERGRMAVCGVLVVAVSLIAALASVAPAEGDVIPNHPVTRTR